MGSVSCRRRVPSTLRREGLLWLLTVEGLVGMYRWAGNREAEISFEESTSTEHSISLHTGGSFSTPRGEQCVDKHRPGLVARACFSVTCWQILQMVGAE